MPERFVNSRTGETEELEYVCNPGGAITDVKMDHAVIRVLQGGGDAGERRTYAGFRYATASEISRYRRRNGLI
jgi:hypothetical protein